MKPIESWQRRALYSIGGSLGLVRRDGDDELHLLMNAQTGKDHMNDLTYHEANDLLQYLRDKMRGNITQPRQAGNMSDGQQKRVWQLMYLLQKQDISSSDISIGVRLCGIIKRQFNISSTPTDPFKWLNYKQGSRLIEILKGYVRSAEAKKEKGNANG